MLYVQILIAKSPLAAFTSFVYTIEAEGLVLQDITERNWEEKKKTQQGRGSFRPLGTQQHFGKENTAAFHLQRPICAGCSLCRCFMDHGRADRWTRASAQFPHSLNMGKLPEVVARWMDLHIQPSPGGGGEGEGETAKEEEEEMKEVKENKTEEEEEPTLQSLLCAWYYAYNI
ncbi:DNA repair protein RAD51 like protein 2 [Fukomys damarensis]|uniref:DNA repair protein RAD51 like protein 2 n=1 Tax=Fukomys damarensis TaxID=885580 RepID=A0A091D147_FUKDA|nr:DNA repair protein RAD51 like protein 2 [Fukomys damarensis]